MRRNPIYTFKDRNAIGIYDVPLESTIQINDADGQGNTQIIQLTSKAGLHKLSTIGEVLDDPTLYEVPSQVGVITDDQKGRPLGVAPLDDRALIPESYLPNFRINDVYVVQTLQEMIALDVNRGDVCVVEDEGKSYINLGSSTGTIQDWHELTFVQPTVQSVNGKTGVVILNTDDIQEGTNKYLTSGSFDALFLQKSIYDLTDVGGSAPQPNEVLTWNGTTWTNMLVNSPVTSVNTKVGDVSLTTDDIPETASGNKYYQDSYVDARIQPALDERLSGLVTITNSTTTEPSLVLNSENNEFAPAVTQNGFYLYNKTTAENTGLRIEDDTLQPGYKLMRLKIAEKTSLKLEYDKAPGTQYDPTEDNHLTRKDYVDAQDAVLQGNIDTLESQTQQDFTTLETTVANNTQQIATVETEANTARTIAESKLLTVQAGTNVSIDSLDPINPIINVDDMSYDDTQLRSDIAAEIDSRFTGKVVISDYTDGDPANDVLGVIVFDDDTTRPVVANNRGYYRFDQTTSKNTGMRFETFDNGGVEEDTIRFKLNDVTSLKLDEGKAPTTQFAPTDINSLTRKDYVDSEILNVVAAADNATIIAQAAQATADSKLASVQAGANITIDNTDPVNPIITATDVVYDDTQIRSDLTDLENRVSIAETDIGNAQTDATNALDTASANESDISDLQLAVSDAQADATDALNAVATKQDDLGLGASGQILATNATADGTEWVSMPAGCDMTTDQCDGIKANSNLSSTNKVVDEAQLLQHENNTLSHLSTDQNAALDGANSPSGTNVVATMADITPKGGITADRPVDPALYTMYWDTEINTGAGGLITCTDNTTGANVWKAADGTAV